MKRGMGSPNYNPERAAVARRNGSKALRELGKAHKWVAESARAAGVKGSEKRWREQDEREAVA